MATNASNGTNNTSGTMERILRLMAEKKASDVYLSATRRRSSGSTGNAFPSTARFFLLMRR
jgi:hypothetical protein